MILQQKVQRESVLALLIEGEMPKKIPILLKAFQILEDKDFKGNAMS